MIRKSEKLLITFYTTTDAMQMEQICKASGVSGRIIPVPGSISADCGLAWSAPLSEEETLRRLMDNNKLRFQGIHRCLI